MLGAFLRSKVEPAYALLRVVAGLLYAFHGAQILFGLRIPARPPVGSQVWIGGVLELATGLAVAAGFQTSWAAFVASGTMAVAYVQFHWKFRFDANFFPAFNQGEPALVNAVLFFFIACRGAGRWGLDRTRAAPPPSPPVAPVNAA